MKQTWILTSRRVRGIAQVRRDSRKKTLSIDDAALIRLLGTDRWGLRYVRIVLKLVLEIKEISANLVYGSFLGIIARDHRVGEVIGDASADMIGQEQEQEDSVGMETFVHEAVDNVALVRA